MQKEIPELVEERGRRGWADASLGAAGARSREPAGPLVHRECTCPVSGCELFSGADVFHAIVIDDVVDVDTPGRRNHPRNSTED